MRGSAVFDNERGAIALHAGERATARTGDAPSLPLPFAIAPDDAFEAWALDQEAARAGTGSADYLPADLQVYGGTLDRYGEWEYAAPYGYVWHPTVTSDKWRWLTQHYGRWELAQNRLCWVPSQPAAPSFSVIAPHHAARPVMPHVPGAPALAVSAFRRATSSPRPRRRPA